MKKGVILVNLGTPTEPNPKEIAKFLARFLRDRRVVRLTPWLWYPILYGIVLPLRSRRICASYRKIWFSQQSPLQYYMWQLTRKLRDRHQDIVIELAMTYSQPTIAQAIAHLQQQQVTKWLVLPLYPQYSTTTTEPVWDQVNYYLRTHPTENFARPLLLHDYATHPHYILALCLSITQAIAQYGEPDAILLSYHGIPLRYVHSGDHYPERCEQTTQALKQQLPNLQDKIVMSYQSRFGKDKWIKPYTDAMLQQLPQRGIKTLFVVCPGFAVDCLETLEEIADENRQCFLNAGGTDYYYIAALNDSLAHLDLCSQLINENLIES